MRKIGQTKKHSPGEEGMLFLHYKDIYLLFGLSVVLYVTTGINMNNKNQSTLEEYSGYIGCLLYKKKRVNCIVCSNIW